LAEIVAVLHLTEVRLGTPDLSAFGPIPNEYIWRVGSPSSSIIMVRDLDWLLFVTRNIWIKIQQEEKVAFEGGFEGAHRLRS